MGETPVISLSNTCSHFLEVGHMRVFIVVYGTTPDKPSTNIEVFMTKEKAHAYMAEQDPSLDEIGKLWVQTWVVEE